MSNYQRVGNDVDYTEDVEDEMEEVADDMNKEFRSDDDPAACDSEVEEFATRKYLNTSAEQARKGKYNPGGSLGRPSISIENTNKLHQNNTKIILKRLQRSHRKGAFLWLLVEFKIY
ncbi:hypothetical protein Bca101_019089 [Brassica carinata]